MVAKNKPHLIYILNKKHYTLFTWYNAKSRFATILGVAWSRILFLWHLGVPQDVFAPACQPDLTLLIPWTFPTGSISASRMLWKINYLLKESALETWQIQFTWKTGRLLLQGWSVCSGRAGSQFHCLPSSLWSGHQALGLRSVVEI